MNRTTQIDPKSALTVPASGTAAPGHGTRLRYVSSIPGRGAPERRGRGKQTPPRLERAERVRQLRDASGGCRSCQAARGQRHNKWGHAWELSMRRVRMDVRGANRITAKPLGFEKLPPMPERLEHYR